MTEFTLDFNQIEDDDTRVGAKGLRLAQLARAGLPVPAGFCVTTAAYQAFLDANKLRPDTPDPAAMLEAQMPPMVVEAVTEACQELAQGNGNGKLALAVRSSATAEDRQQASFAGQYDTFLNVVVDGNTTPLLNAIRACWASLWNDRAGTYSARNGLSNHQMEMAVVVQRQVAAQAAGVLFTLNPLTGREQEMMIEAVWGLGEPLVSGQVVPDRYIVNAYDHCVLQRELADHPTMCNTAEGGGVQTSPVPADWRGHSVLNDAQLLELAELAYQVQAFYGYPQDVEWAVAGSQFLVLQARPLTAYHFDVEMGQWTSANYREVMPGFPSPLAMSLSLEREYGRALAKMFRDIKMGEAPPGTVWGRPLFGRAYWNVGITKQFTALVPGFKERTFDATVGIEPTYEGDGLTTPWTLRTILRALPILFALERRYETCWQEAAAFSDRFCQREEPRVARVDPSSLSDAELGTWVRQMVDLHARTNHIAITISLLATQAQDEFAPVLASLNRRLAPQDAILFGDLITGLGDVQTAKPTLELYDLARYAQQTRAIAAAISEGTAEEIPQRLGASAVGRAFWEQVEAFIRRYYYMGSVDEDLAQPRWDEDASFILITLQSYVRDMGHDTRADMAAQRERARAAEAKATAILSQGLRRLWPFARRSFLHQLERVRRYVWWREEMRVVASRAFYHCRRFFLELGRRWAKSGWLQEPDGIFLLRWDDIQEVLEGRRDPDALHRAIGRYLRLRAAYRNFEPPSVIGRGARFTPSTPKGQASLKGIPCSTGRATGPARVASSLEEASALQKGEILVAQYTNPGWTPLFNLISGLIIESGGLLSHCAVVAREYGIPAVIGVEQATRLLHTGQVVTVDGATGTVEVIMT